MIYVKGVSEAMKLEGIYAPLPTPFDDDDTGRLDIGGFRSNLLAWSTATLDGVVVCGSNGELPFTTVRERSILTEEARKIFGGAPGGKKIITGAFMHSEDETVSCCRSVAQSGADAVLMLPPCYFKGQGTPGAINFFRNVADKSPIPVVLYNMPANTGVDLETEAILKLAEHPNIIGIKDTSGNMTKIGYLAAWADKNDAGFSVFCGSGNYFLPALSLGVSGGTLAVANLYPESCRELMLDYRAGRVEEAKNLQRRLLRASDALTAKFGVPGLKAAMDRAGLRGGPCRAPLLPLDEASRQTLFSVLDEADLDSRETWRRT
jgi:4-hydroxy-2-oxoglutarate aldolase